MKVSPWSPLDFQKIACQSNLALVRGLDTPCYLLAGLELLCSWSARVTSVNSFHSSIFQKQMEKRRHMKYIMIFTNAVPCHNSLWRQSWSKNELVILLIRLWFLFMLEDINLKSLMHKENRQFLQVHKGPNPPNHKNCHFCPLPLGTFIQPKRRCSIITLAVFNGGSNVG